LDVNVEKKFAPLAALAITFALVCAGASPAIAAPVVDQTQSVTAAGEAAVSCYVDMSSNPQCQVQGSTFTAGMSGRLTSIDIPTIRHTTPADLTVNVWNVDAVTGFPTGSAIATQVIPAASLVSGGTISVLFSSPATVVAGTGYVFTLEFPLSSASSNAGMMLALGFSPPDKRVAGFAFIEPAYGISFTTYVDDAPVADPTSDSSLLADTGTNASVNSGSIALGAGLLMAGALAVTVTRRRLARS
jgi:azurin